MKGCRSPCADRSLSFRHQSDRYPLVTCGRWRSMNLEYDGARLGCSGVRARGCSSRRRTSIDCLSAMACATNGMRRDASSHSRDGGARGFSSLLRFVTVRAHRPVRERCSCREVFDPIFALRASVRRTHRRRRHNVLRSGLSSLLRFVTVRVQRPARERWCRHRNDPTFAPFCTPGTSARKWGSRSVLSFRPRFALHDHPGTRQQRGRALRPSCGARSRTCN